MPPKNSLKTFTEGGYYHIYNRGVAKQDIFLSPQDYTVFLRFLKEYLLPVNHPDLKALQTLSPRRYPVNCHENVKLLAYCLMPNHFHLLAKNTTQKGIEKFMRALGTNYSMYFNKTYNRVGHLYQGTYKAVLVEKDEQLLYLSKYIHKNPEKLSPRESPLYEYSYSSYPNYLNKRKQDWLHTDEILPFFSEEFPSLSYRAFIEEQEQGASFQNISSLVLEED